MLNDFKAVAVQLSALLILLMAPSGLFAQDRGESHLRIDQHPILQSIEIASQNGFISKEEALLQKIYAGLDLERLDPVFRTEDAPPIKCLMPMMAEYENLKRELSPAISAEIEKLLYTESPSQVGNSYLSPSGKFNLIYDTSGSHAVPTEDSNNSDVPDYIEKAAFAADSSYRHMVETLGFKDFIKDEPYQISFRNMKFYGRHISSGSTSRIEVNNDFDGFPPNTHPDGDVIGALYVTIAHELKHASQFQVNRLRGDTGRADWIEMDATLMEHVVFPGVNDYYNYIMDFTEQRNDWDRNSPHELSIFDNPGSATPGLYWHVTWMIYFHEKFGAEFWVDVWDVIDQDENKGTDNALTFLESMDQVLSIKGLSIKTEHIHNHTWHMSSGPDFSHYNFGFSDRENYPNASLGEAQNLSASSPTFISSPNQVIQPFAARYHDLVPSGLALGQPLFILDSGESTGIGLGIVGYFRDGSVEQKVVLNPNSNRQILQTTWSWADLVDVNVAVINSNQSGVASYTLEINSIEPDEDIISQNFPNPFNPTTRIEFALSDTKDVLIDVYDPLGRKVTTLVNGRLNSGFHSIIFDGSGLASGVYLYRIVTDQTVISKKMMLIK